MSLIKCPECGKVFSDRAAHCPQCGLPTSEALKAIVSDGTAPAAPVADTPAPEQTVSQTPYYGPGYGQPQPKKQNNLLLYILICVVIVLAIVLIAIFLHDKFSGTEPFPEATDSTMVDKELPADTIPAYKEEEKVDLPKTVAAPVEAEPEVLPDASETEEIKITPEPAPAPATEPAPAPAPANTPAE